MVNLFIMRDKYGFLSRNQTLQAGIRKCLHQQSTDNNGRGRRRGQSLEQEAVGAEGSEGNCTQAEKAPISGVFWREMMTGSLVPVNTVPETSPPPPVKGGGGGLPRVRQDSSTISALKLPCLYLSAVH